MWNRIAAVTITLLTSFCAQAVIYYVSPTGNDANNGTSTATPWRTIARVNQSAGSIQAGDQVLFQRGGVYRGKLQFTTNGTATNKITIGSYGSGDQPVISGSVEVTGWTVHSGNIWKANVGQRVHFVYVNGAMQTMARFPNSGWLRVDNGTATSITDADLNQGSGYWTGATAVIRTTQWSYDTAFVSAHSGTTITHSSTGNNLGSQQWGYFMRNKLALLDSPGEWFYDRATGILYLWCPGNANPNSVQVEAAVTDHGINFNFQRTHYIINGLAFRHQTDCSVRLTGTTNIELMNCTFSHIHRAIYSTGSNQNIHHNSITQAYSLGMHLLDNNTTIANNSFQNIAEHPGLGQNDWGYFGIRTSGNGLIIRENTMQNVGYIGIVTAGNALVERNVLRNMLTILNDGGAIAFDGTDGLIVRNNIIVDAVGNIESKAPNSANHFPICHGIYFGNITNKNCLVEKNTVANYASGGIHVDHTMVFTGNTIRDNVLYNNGVQLSISDYSNYNGPGATQPYHVPSFNTVYTGNVMYSLSREQLCMSQLHVYSNNWVDFGTFNNNYYFSPYNEVSIEQWCMFNGTRKYFTMERWQTERSEDPNSARSPLRQDLFTTTNELSSNLVVNGNFTNNVTGWSGWPSNAQVSRVTTHLDNGCLRGHLPNNQLSSEFSLRNPDPFAVTNGQWYRLRFSLQAPDHGTIKAGLKGQSQMTGPNWISMREFPFSPERRDLEFHFQSNLSDQAMVQFLNHYLEPTYFLDNVELHRVSVNPVVPTDDHVLVYNETSTAQTYPLGTGTWKTVQGTTLTGSITLQPFTSTVVYRTSTTGGTGSTVGAKVFLDGALNWTTVVMRTSLRQQGLLPNTEPFTALGIAVQNTGATAGTSVWNATGNQQVVDWVVLELRNADAGHTVAERRAALVRADGSVVDMAGGTQITFSTAVAGKRLVIHHRNHLAAMTSATIAQNGATIDFTVPGTALYGTNAMKTDGSKRALWPGDVTRDGMTRYAGTGNDRDPVLVRVGSLVPTNTVSGYFLEDVNLDGQVKYAGTDNDRDFILTTVGGTVPTNTRPAQLP